MVQLRERCSSPILWKCMLIGALCVIAGCAKSKPVNEPSGGEPPAPAQSDTITVENAGLQTPESVLYDSDGDIYLVSNINGAPLAKDNNGFISKVMPDGTVSELKWISGGTTNVTLNAPKGMTILDDSLYVADIDVVRIFDRNTGESKGNIDVAGATFLNDIMTSKNNRIYITDTGWMVGDNGFDPTGTDAVFTLKDGQLTQLVSGTQLHNPNGVTCTNSGIMMVNAGGELFSITPDGTMGDAIKLPGAGLDGIVQAADNTLLISSWETKTVFKGPKEGPFTPLIENVTSPADIGFDSKRNRVLIPLFLENKLMFVPL